MKGYRWGKFQGWATFVVGLITFLSTPWTGVGIVERSAFYTVGAWQIALGLELAHKRRLGLILLYAALPLLILAFYDSKQPGDEWVFLTCWYVIPAAFYYPKRWKEFSRGAFLNYSQVVEPGDSRSGPVVQQGYTQVAIQDRKAAGPGDALEQYKQGLMYHLGLGVPQDNKKSAIWFRKAADQGDSDAQFELGSQYWYGRSVSQDYEQAAIWFRKAADQGNAQAQCCLGTLYDLGQGVPEDSKQAAIWFRRSAEQGFASAQYSLGLSYHHGRGVSQDYNQAAVWYRKAADQGDAEAQNNLGALYAQGHGVPQDYAQAVAWCRKAAEQGNANAQFNLGACYNNGEGVPQSYSEAYFWMDQAAAGMTGSKRETAAKNRAAAAAKLTPAELSKVQERAAIWFRKAADQGNAEAEKTCSALHKCAPDVPEDSIKTIPYQLPVEQGKAEAKKNASHKSSVDAQKDSTGAASCRVAAARGNAEAQNHLGVVYERGQGVPQDYTQAANWYRKAAEQGNSYAQHNLGLLYTVGRGVSQDWAQAYFWLYISASGDLQPSQEKYAEDRAAAAVKLTPTERSEVNKEANRWLAAHARR